MFRPGFAFLLIVSASMAGCAGATISPEARATQGEVAPPAQFTEDTGAIEGLVTDDQLVPLADAEVLLVEIGTPTITDAQGRFSFSFLPAGPVSVRASRADHVPRTEAVEVEAGTITQVRLALQPMAVVEPYQLTRSAAGHILFSMHLNLTGVYNSYPFNSPNDDDVGYFPIPTTDGLVTAIGEASWRSTQALGAELIMAFNFKNWNMTNAPSGYYDYRLMGVALLAGPSPLRGVLDGDRLEQFHDRWALKDCGPMSRCEAQVFMRSHRTGHGLTVTSDQRFEAYYSEFFHQAAPPGFSALPDA